MIDKGQWGEFGPTLYEKCHGIINDDRKSGPRFNVSSKILACN